MKRTRARPRLRVLRLLSLSLVLPLWIACGGDGAADGSARVAVGDSATAGGEAAAPAIAPADTATRRVSEALTAYQAPDSAAADSAGAQPVQYRAGENPVFAAQQGWPVKYPHLPEAILPDKRILCYYGNPNSTRMGALGEFPKDDMLRRLNVEVTKWTQADPAHPALPCLHMVAVVAQGEAGTSGHFRSIMQDSLVREVHSWAKEADGIFIVDIQVGTDDIRNLMPRFEWILKEPDVHFAVDPEFMMKGGERPGSKIGTMNASDINYVTGELARIVRENDLPPKVLVIHRFTRNMVTGTEDILLRPEVQIVMDMDGWGAPWLKRDSYRDYVVRYPVQFTGFKLFYNNDTKAGDPLMQPADLLKLHPIPLYIQYQ